MQTATSPNPHPPPASSSRRRPNYNDEVPQWLPLTLLAVTTAALAGPVYLLRKQRASALLRVKALPMRKVRLDARYTPLANVPKPTNNIASERKTVTQGPPPRRRVAADASRSLSLANVGMHPAAQSLPAQQNLHQEDGERPADEGATFDGLRAAGAFGTATLIVFVTATVGVWGVKTHLGIETTEEFSRHMRYWVATKLSWLSQRIHRQILSDSPAEPSSSLALSTAAPTDSAPGGEGDWSWDEAEARLGKALDTGGAYAWAKAVGQEIEAEAEMGRREREGLVKEGLKSRT